MFTFGSCLNVRMDFIFSPDDVPEVKRLFVFTRIVLCILALFSLNRWVEYKMNALNSLPGGQNNVHVLMCEYYFCFTTYSQVHPRGCVWATSCSFFSTKYWCVRFFVNVCDTTELVPRQFFTTRHQKGTRTYCVYFFWVFTYNLL